MLGDVPKFSDRQAWSGVAISEGGALLLPIIVAFVHLGAGPLWITQHPCTRRRLEGLGYTQARLLPDVARQLADPDWGGRSIGGHPVLLYLACSQFPDAEGDR